MMHCLRRCGPKGIQDLKGEQSVVWHLAFLDGKLHNRKDALKWWERLIVLSEELNDMTGLKNAHENAAKLKKDHLSMPKDAISHYEWAYSWAANRGDVEYAANALENIFDCFHSLHQFAEAIGTAERVIKLMKDTMGAVEKPGDMFPVPETHPHREDAIEFNKEKFTTTKWKERYWDCFHFWIENRCKMAECIQLQGRRLELSKEILEKCCADAQEVIEKRGKYGQHGHPARGPYRTAQVAWRWRANFHCRKEEWVEACAALEEMVLHRKRGRFCQSA